MQDNSEKENKKDGKKVEHVRINRRRRRRRGKEEDGEGGGGGDCEWLTKFFNIRKVNE